MQLSDRLRKKGDSIESDYGRLSALGDVPDAWAELDKEELKQVILIKCFDYGISQDGSLIPGLFELYRHAMKVLGAQERLQLLTQFSKMTEEQIGAGHMGLMTFMVADNDLAVCSSAALSLSVMYDPEGGGPLAGPSFVVSSLINREGQPKAQGAGLGGVLLLGDKRVMPLLKEVWDQLPEEAQLEMTKVKSGFISEAMVNFWLWCLEQGCSQSVFGSIVAALTKMPVIAQMPFVLEIRRLFPAYGGGEPMEILKGTSFIDYLAKIEPRLDGLEREETEPKLIPRLREVWRNPERFAGLIA